MPGVRVKNAVFNCKKILKSIVKKTNYEVAHHLFHHSCQFRSTKPQRICSLATHQSSWGRLLLVCELAWPCLGAWLVSLLFFAVGRDLRGRLKQSFVARRQESNESEGSCRTRQCFHVVFFALRRPYGCRACQEPGKIFLQHCAQCGAAHSFALFAILLSRLCEFP